jgi:hypothetical protein
VLALVAAILPITPMPSPLKHRPSSRWIAPLTVGLALTTGEASGCVHRALSSTTPAQATSHEGESAAALLAEVEAATQSFDAGALAERMVAEDQEPFAAIVVMQVHSLVMGHAVLRGMMRGLGAKPSPEHVDEDEGIATRFQEVLSSHGVTVNTQEPPTFKGTNYSALLRDLTPILQDLAAMPDATFNLPVPRFDGTSLRQESEDRASVGVVGFSGRAQLRRVSRRWLLAISESELGDPVLSEAEEQLRRFTEWDARRRQADREALRAAAHGRWQGEEARLTFEQDGRAVLQQGTGEPETGTLVVSDYEIGIEEGDSTSLYAAYLDKQGRLHFATVIGPDPAPIDEEGRARVRLDMFKTLRLEAGRCQVEDDFHHSVSDIPCRYEQRYGHNELWFDATALGILGDGRLRHLVEEQLLVPPELHDAIFTRVP